MYLRNHSRDKRRKWWTYMVACFVIWIGAFTFAWTKATSIIEKKVSPALKEYFAIKDRSNKISLIERTLTIRYQDTLTYIEIKFYAPVFFEAAEKYGVDWEIFPAIKFSESRWRGCGIRSDSGALGPMQVLEGTGEAECAELGIHYVKGVTLRNDILNTVIGCAYVAKKIKSLIKQGNQNPYYEVAQYYISGPRYKTNLGKGVKTRDKILDYSKRVFEDYASLSYIYSDIQLDSLSK